MLVIPALDLQEGHCVRVRDGRYEDERTYFVEPVRMAKLWRVMNAKVLHVADHDAEDETGPRNHAVIRRLAETLDIPIEVSAGLRRLDDVAAVLDLGVYRAILDAEAARDAGLVESALERFGARRIVVGLNAGHESADALAARAAELEQRGVRRFVCFDTVRGSTLAGPNVATYRAVATGLDKARITAAGGVGGYRDLLALQALEPLGVDSVVVGRALYENQFPCQQFWCWHYKDEVDLDRFSTARLLLQKPAAS